MLNHEDLTKIERLKTQELRWNILRMIDTSRPISISENLLQRAIGNENHCVPLNVLRRELDYLEKEKLLTIDRRNTWFVELTAKGIDVVYYILPVPLGIARPEVV